MMQANQVTKKTLKMSSVPATGAQETKYKKPKPTNPKPFRLRTDVSETFSDQFIYFLSALIKVQSCILHLYMFTFRKGAFSRKQIWRRNKPHL